MLYRTSHFTDLIRKDIANGDILRAIKLLTNSLPKKSEFNDQAIVLLSQYNQLYEKELLGFGWQNEHKNIITNSVLILLKRIESRYPSTIELKSTSLKNKIESISPRKKKQSKINIKKPLALTGVIILIIIIISYLYRDTTSTEISANHLLPSSASDFMITLNTYNNFNDAKREMLKYQKRNIEIVRYNSLFGVQYSTIIQGFQNQTAANSALIRLKKYAHWKGAKVNNAFEKCSRISKKDIDGISFWMCK